MPCCGVKNACVFGAHSFGRPQGSPLQVFFRRGGACPLPFFLAQYLLRAEFYATVLGFVPSPNLAEIRMDFTSFNKPCPYSLCRIIQKLKKLQQLSNIRFDRLGGKRK